MRTKRQPPFTLAIEYGEDLMDIHFRMHITKAALIVAACSMLGISCATPQQQQAKKQAQVKAALFVDEGSYGNGMRHWIRLLEYSPQIQLDFIDGKAIREGGLKDFDLVVFPGGYAPTQYESLQEEGAAAVREFVQNGGSYLGICAGFACALNAPKRIRLLPFGRKPNAGGRSAMLAVDISEKGGKVLDVAPGRYLVPFQAGPIPCPGEKPGEGWGEGLAVYKSVVSRIDNPEPNFFGEYAILHGQFGKGKVIAIGCHPESYESTQCIALGAVYAVTGVKPIPCYPAKKPRPLHVGFHALDSSLPGIRQMLELDRNPEIDVMLISSQKIDEGILNHLDVLFMTNAPEETYAKIMDNPLRASQFSRFLEQGGRIVTFANAAKALPKHRNVRLIDNDNAMEKAIFGR